MISELHLKFGSNPGSPLSVNLTPITVFVGPNNSGKSRILTEIEQYCTTGPQANALILDRMEFVPHSSDASRQAIKALEVLPGEGETLQADAVMVGS